VCVRQNRVVLAVVATVKPWRRRHSRQPARCPRLSRGRGRPERTRLPGEHGISRKATAQGRPCVGLHLYAAVQFLLRYPRTADRGCQPAPGLPCALFDEGDGESIARAKCAARMRACVCARETRCGERRMGRAQRNPSPPSLREKLDGFRCSTHPTVCLCSTLPVGSGTPAARTDARPARSSAVRRAAAGSACAGRARVTARRSCLRSAAA
jgi:hypothetical protein